MAKDKDLKEITVVEDGITHVGRASSEQVAAWKKELRAKEQGEAVHEMAVTHSNGKEISYGYVAEPERIHTAKVMSMLGKAEILPAGEYIINNLWLGGDPRIKTEKWLNFNASMQASEIVEFLDTKVKKL